jgi:D-aminopeptidase
MNQKRIRDYGITIGSHPTGLLNAITDVDGVTVGHCTIDTDSHKTGVTIIKPSTENIFTNKLIAASYVLNGFGKTIGLMQIDELGTLESPIALTNTLNVGLVSDALVSYTIDECKKENREHQHMQELGQETSEKPRNKSHFSHKLSVTKLVNIFFSHKY